MFKFTRTGVFGVSIIIIFIFMQIFINQYTIETEINEEIMERKFLEELQKTQTTEESKTWQIEIPKISIIANISEGTTKEVLNKYVGHFENTSKQEGNVGLAARNRGGEINYFKELKKLKQGDEIKYRYNKFEKIYEVEKCRIIKENELEYLEETEENMLTLITYIENQSKYRRCIQAIEKEEQQHH